jgi:quinol monooxygenase YgiN
MVKVALLVRLEAKPGKEEKVAKFLTSALALANQEATTPVWFAIRSGARSFVIFDAFADEGGRKAHLSGPIAAALMANAEELLIKAPHIEQCDVLAAKLSREL